MRRSEITPELIELSKRAKALGFPQDVEEGDWVKPDDDKGYEYEPFCIGYIAEDSKQIGTWDGDHKMTWWEAEEMTLILSFSRCLEWLSEKYESLECWRNTRNQRWYFRWKDELWVWGKTHHEAIAKAVVKILEEQ